MTIPKSSRGIGSVALLVFVVIVHSGAGASSSNNLNSNSASFIYSAGRGKTNKKDLSNNLLSTPAAAYAINSNSIAPQQALVNGASSLVSTAFVEPRGDYGGGYGGSGGGYGGGGGGGYGGGHPAGVYHYSIQPHGGGGGGWGPPMYYQEDDGGFDKGLLGLLGLGGLKGLLGLAALLKLLLPLLLLFIPLLLPLLLAKAALLFALLLLIPIPVITPGRSLPRDKTSPGGSAGASGIEESAKSFLQDSLSELMGKIPIDLQHIIGKIKDSDLFKWNQNMSKTKSKVKSHVKSELWKSDLNKSSGVESS